MITALVRISMGVAELAAVIGIGVVVGLIIGASIAWRR